MNLICFLFGHKRHKDGDFTIGGFYCCKRCHHTDAPGYESMNAKHGHIHGVLRPDFWYHGIRNKCKDWYAGHLFFRPNGIIAKAHNILFPQGPDLPF